MMKSIAELNESGPFRFVRRYLATLIVVLAVLAGGVYYFQVQQERKFINCQTNYNTALATQLINRSKLFQQADNNRDALIRGVGNLVLSPPAKGAKELARRGEIYRNLFVTYGDSADRLDKERAHTLLPPIPDC